VHVIDKVLLPQEALDALMPPTPNIVELAMDTEFLSILVGALVQADAGLVDLLQTEGPFTVFAPTDTAFAALLDALGDDYNGLGDFDTPEEKALLAQILKYHVIAGTAAYSTDLSNGQMVETAQGESVTVNLTGGVFIQDKTDVDAAVAPADIAASNGVVHVIDKVLLPQEAIDALLH
ncbi:fasciclin domain-containing protein, partial [Arenibacter sp. S6351L]